MFGMKLEPITESQRAIFGADYVAFGDTIYVPQAVIDALRDLGSAGGTSTALTQQVEWRKHWYRRPGDAWWER